MTRIKMLSTKSHVFAGARREVGDPVEATPRERKILIATRRAVDAPAIVASAEPPKKEAEPEAKAEPVVETKALEAETQAEVQTEPAAGTYQTRVMTAETPPRTRRRTA